MALQQLEILLMMLKLIVIQLFQPVSSLFDLEITHGRRQIHQQSGYFISIIRLFLLLCVDFEQFFLLFSSGRVFAHLSEGVAFCWSELKKGFVIAGYFIDDGIDILGVGDLLIASDQVDQVLNPLFHLNLLQPFSSLQFITQNFYSTSMDPSLEEVAQKYGKPRKKVKREQKEEAEGDDWIVVKGKETELTISISDYSRVNRFYSHRSIQGYLRYILAQSVPNPMWLSIKRQSLIEQIIYIDLQIESNVFQSMLCKKELKFLSSLVNETNKALFKFNGKMFREDLWECLLGCQTEQNIQEIQGQKNIHELPQKLNEQLFKKYQKYIMTAEELKSHLYPTKELPIYADFYQLQNSDTNEPEWKNKILIIDCEMVVSEAGFELARTTIVNFQGEVVFDELFKPDVQIINYNTEFSGITKEMLDPVINTPVSKLYPFLETIVCKDTIMVGHSLQNDLRAMKLIHKRVIDSAVLFMRKNGTKFKLKNLSDKILNRKIQVGEHDSKEDCLATLHLIRAKIENDQQIKKKDFQVLKQIEQAKKSVALVDYAIDYEMKAFAGNHYQKIEMFERSANIFKVVKKYLRRDVAIPCLILTRIEKPESIEWEDYYKQFDSSFQEFHSCIPKKTAIFLNCQVNPKVTVLIAGEPLKLSSNIRCPCFILAV